MNQALNSAASSSQEINRCISLPVGAPLTLRQRLGLRRDEKPRLAYLGGPGDVQGTFDHWVAGRFDPRVPVIAYSTMFYELVKQLDAEAMVIADIANKPVSTVPAFRFVQLPRQHVSGRFRYWAEGLRYALAVARQLRKYAPHAVIIGPHPAILMTLLPTSMRVMLTVHNTYWPMGRRPHGIAQRVKLGFYGRGLKRAAGGVCTSQECFRQTAELRGSAENLFVELPQVLAECDPAERSSRVLRQLLYLGRLEVDKGIFDLLDVFESIASACPELRLDFAGSGSSMASLVARKMASKFTDRVRILGQLSGQDVHAALERTDLLVCPTRTEFNEGLALVVVEAAAHGVPTLLSSVVPAKEAVAGACVEFPADDTDALRARLKALVDDRESFSALRAQVWAMRDMFSDRQQSWGSHMYRALVC